MVVTTMFFFKFLFFAGAPKGGDIPQTIYEYKVPALTGGTIDFSDFKGKKIMIVNTASKCGLTPQYEGLEALYQKYKDKLVIVGFPANDFMSQEPGSNKDIAEFCQRNYGVSFPMAEKITVVGKKMAPIYQWLTLKEHNGFQNSTVKWNFQKYLIDEEGNLTHVFNPKVKPMSEEVIAAIED